MEVSDFRTQCRHPSVRKLVKAVLWCFGIGAVALGTLIWWAFSPTTVGTAKLAGGIKITLFTEPDWDVGNTLCFTISEGWKTRIPGTYIGFHDPENELTLTNLTSADGTIVGVYGRSRGSAGVSANIGGGFRPMDAGSEFLILYDRPSGDCWPWALSEVGSDRRDEVAARWSPRMRSVWLANRNMPVPLGFEAVTNQVVHRP